MSDEVILEAVNEFLSEQEHKDYVASIRALNMSRTSDTSVRIIKNGKIYKHDHYEHWREVDN